MRKPCFAVVNLPLLLPFFFGASLCRPLIPNGLVSDGVNENGFSSANPLAFKLGLESGEGQSCEQMYGFLPCSKTISGHLFLIVVYEYLLFHAESYVASGGERIFKILGPGVFGASAFQLIGSLPEASILLASGLWSSNENVQEYVSTAVELLAGSSILLLTVVWGSCILAGRRSLPNQLLPNPSGNGTQRLWLPLFSEHGVLTHSKTRDMSKIMLLSMIPLVMIQIPRTFHLSYAGERTFVLITLVCSVIFLLCYFIYQFFRPWIQVKRLKRLAAYILEYKLQNQRRAKLRRNDRSVDVSTIRRLFQEIDLDEGNVISVPELKQSLLEAKHKQPQEDEDDTVAKIGEEFDADKDGKITSDDFVKGMRRRLDETKGKKNKRHHSVKGMDQVIQPLIQKKKEERQTMEKLIPVILEHLQNTAYEKLMSEDGTPNVSAIQKLFDEINLDKSDYVTYPELKKLVTKIDFQNIPYDADVVASKVMEELDSCGNYLISKDEFVDGLCRWLNATYQESTNSDSEEDDHETTREQIDKLAERKLIDRSPSGWMKALGLIALGIVMLGLLAEPLIHSVRQFSTAARVPSFFPAFIFVPVATNARIAVFVVSEAREKTKDAASLTLSEIYGTVFMNNVLGLAVLLSLIYFRGLSWNFSVEVLIVVIVTAVIGSLASCNKVFRVWTLILAYILYPLSLILIYILGDLNWLS